MIGVSGGALCQSAEVGHMEETARLKELLYSALPVWIPVIAINT